MEAEERRGRTKGGMRRQKSRRGGRRKAGRYGAMSRGVKGKPGTTTMDGDHPRTHTSQNSSTSSSSSPLVDSAKIQ